MHICVAQAYEKNEISLRNCPYYIWHILELARLVPTSQFITLLIFQDSIAKICNSGLDYRLVKRHTRTATILSKYNAYLQLLNDASFPWLGALL